MPSTKPQIIVRCTHQQKEAFARMAYRHGKSLSAWIVEAAESQFEVASPQGGTVPAV